MAEKGKQATTSPGQDEVVLDFSGVRPFEPLDDTKWYMVSASKFELGRASAERGGKPKASLELTVIKPEAYKGRKLFREFSLQSQALPFLFQFIRAVEPDAVLDENFIFKPSEYIGLECAVRIRNEEFEEQVRSRVGRMSPTSAYRES